MQDNSGDFGAELDAMLKNLEKQPGKPKEDLSFHAVPKHKPTRFENQKFLETKKRRKVARRSRRVNRGKRGGKRR